MHIRSILAAAAFACCFGTNTLAANPMYDSWAAHKPGTSVTMAGTNDVAGNKSEMGQVYTLKSVTPEKVVIEIVSSMMMMGTKTDMPPTTMEIPAAAPAAPPATPNAPAPAADTKTTDEKVTVAGKEYKATCTVTKADANGMKMTSTVWTSPEIPGMTLKMVSEGEGQMKMSTKMEVTKVEIK